MTLKASQTRIPADAFNRVVDRGERIAIKRQDGRSVVLISEEDAQLLEMLEDRYWGERAEQVLAEMKALKQKPIPLETVKKRLKLREM
jgi:PHD/YefM family antitoxin component YafN of YafNO toxin-antitoxin module